jgi:hypothetical protein
MLCIILLVYAGFYRAQQYDKIKLEALSRVVDPIAFACAEAINYGNTAKADAVICMEKVRK